MWFFLIFPTNNIFGSIVSRCLLADSLMNSTWHRYYAFRQLSESGFGIVILFVAQWRQCEEERTEIFKLIKSHCKR